MAETQTHTQENGQVTAALAQNSVKPTSQNQKRGPSIHQIYALPAPIRTFPLPAFYPNNPLSFFTVAYAWLRQILSPPPGEPLIVHGGVWSEATGSVHVTDEKSMRALWEQGFYGKGSLSRSEPNWLKRELVRRGRQETHVSEILTSQRREERAQAKWERARLEQEAIRQTRLKEAELAAATKLSTLATLLPPPCPAAAHVPVGPLELLALPNSEADRVAKSMTNGIHDTLVGVRAAAQALTIPLPSDVLPSSMVENRVNCSETATTIASSDVNGTVTIEAGQPLTSEESSFCDASEEKCSKRQKSVRFSPKVESTTINLADPPSPRHSANSKAKEALSNGDINGLGLLDVVESSMVQTGPDASDEGIVNMEHLQLTPEEAFFLTFGLGALSITDHHSGRAYTNRELLTLFRQFSYFPPRNEPDEPDLEPDDGFLLHYAVYHHFRSLGWVPRAGIKFGVDWLLYTRGPVFDHAEFGIIIIPSYSDPWWKARSKRGPEKPWHWLHSVVRVLSHVIKSLVLVYVDVPPPPKFDVAMETGYAEALKLYRVREVTVKRWSSNRNR
ncbi:hypothetical protein C2857_004253 [Epichloe festucae Fl1]|uniref:tRNA-intron lyase n=1 Tax=Epichloe festucae (strain Fl1) TaxID=877507 RepID=A0A7S9KP29_EPIFF|nr:hypothetical protein C2857_004253 [Epichloe festucae Fl1]